MSKRVCFAVQKVDRCPRQGAQRQIDQRSSQAEEGLRRMSENGSTRPPMEDSTARVGIIEFALNKWPLGLLTPLFSLSFPMRLFYLLINCPPFADTKRAVAVPLSLPSNQILSVQNSIPGPRGFGVLGFWGFGGVRLWDG